MTESNTSNSTKLLLPPLESPLIVRRERNGSFSLDWSTFDPQSPTNTIGSQPVSPEDQGFENDSSSVHQRRSKIITQQIKGLKGFLMRKNKKFRQAHSQQPGTTNGTITPNSTQECRHEGVVAEDGVRDAEEEDEEDEVDDEETVRLNEEKLRFLEDELCTWINSSPSPFEQNISETTTT